MIISKFEELYLFLHPESLYILKVHRDLEEIDNIAIVFYSQTNKISQHGVFRNQ